MTNHTPRCRPASPVVPIQPDPDELAFFEGGPKFKIIICSSNIGNKMIREIGAWVPKEPEHTDLVVIGMQESTYKVKPEDEAEDEEESDVRAGCCRAVLVPRCAARNHATPSRPDQYSLFNPSRTTKRRRLTCLTRLTWKRRTPRSCSRPLLLVLLPLLPCHASRRRAVAGSA